MDAFLNQLTIVLLVGVAALVAFAAYKVVYAKMNQVDIAEEPAEAPEELNDNDKPIRTCPVIRARGEVAETHEEKGEIEDEGLTENVEDNE